MAGYVFIGNSSKPSIEKLNSREIVKFDNVVKPCVKVAMDMGYHVVIGVNRNRPQELKCKDFDVELYDSHTYRSITAIKDNYIAYQHLKALVKKYDIKVIHCNTPVGGMIGRLVGRRYKVKKVIYTAHGFHFYKGAPLFNRTVLKWAEQIMAHWTDAIITMNEEDYQAAKKFNLKKDGKVFKMHGVGITLNEYRDIYVNRVEKRAEIGLKEKDIVCISAGDLVARKNYGIAIEAIARTGNQNIQYIICGEGPEKEKLKQIAIDNGVADRIHILGFRTDVKELMGISDIFLFTTLQEGMPRSMMEALACGLPCIASEIRGNVDLIKNNENGYLSNPCDSKAFSVALNKLANSQELRKKMKDKNLEEIKAYDVSEVEQEIKSIYQEILRKK